MAQRATPEQIFAVRRNVQTQEPLQVTPTTTLQLAGEIDPNILIFGLVALVAVAGLIGLFAYLGHDKKCR